MIDSQFIGLNQKALDFLDLAGRPARRKVIIEYEDGTSKVISEHKFLEISYETRSSDTSNHLPLIAYFSDGKLLYEERIQTELEFKIFTALWDAQDHVWVSRTLWNDKEILEFL